MVIRQGKEVEAWNGVGWHTVAGTDVCTAGPPGPCELSDVSCASPAVCMAIGTLAIDDNGDLGGWAYFYNGHHWTASMPPDTALVHVACSGQGLCMATGAGADGYASATGWTRDSPGPSCGSDCGIAVPSISCTGLTNCMVINSILWTSYTWNGTEWNQVNLAARPAPPGFLGGLACATATDCILTGGYHRDGSITAFSERWNGTNWLSVKTPSPS